MLESKIDLIIAGEKNQQKWGGKLAEFCAQKNCVIYLQGDLGAGKTTFARGFLQKLGYRGRVKSPTYTWMESYEFEKQLVVHIDLYRMNHPEEIFMLGLKAIKNENIHQAVIYLIEWPERAPKELPEPDITCYISPCDNKRHCKLMSHTLQGKEIILAIQKKLRKNLSHE